MAEHGDIRGGAGAAEKASSFKRLLDAASEKPAKSARPRENASKVENLNRQAVVKKQKEIAVKMLEKTPKATLENLPASERLLNLAQVAVDDKTFAAAGQAEAVQKKLLDLRTILTSTPPSQQVEALATFFKQADNWTLEAAPYMSIAREFVMEHLHQQPPEPYNVLTAGELVNRADDQLEDYGEHIDEEAQEHENPTVASALTNEDLDNYFVMKDFSALPSSQSVPAGMKDFAGKWGERVELVQKGGQSYWDVFDQARLQEDLKHLDDLVNAGKASSADVQPWRTTINKYLKALETARQNARAGRYERNSISIEDIEKNSSGHWKDYPRPIGPYEFSQYLKQDDLEMLKQDKGEERWFKKYLLEKIASPRGEAQPTFTEGIRLEEVEHFLEWKYGEGAGLEKKLDMRRIRFGVEHAHQLNKLFTQEGLSAEKMLEVYMQLTPDDFNFLHEFTDVNRALPIYEYVIHTHLSDLRARWFQLRDGDKSLGILSQNERDQRIKVLEQKIHLTPDIIDAKKNELEALQKQPGGIKSEKDKKVAEVLENEIADAAKTPRGSLQNLSDDKLELARLKDEQIELGYGVALWDSDWSYNPHEFKRVSTKWDRIKELQRKTVRSVAEEHELSELNAYQIELDSLLARTSRSPEQQKRVDTLKKKITEEQDVRDNLGLSILEIKVKKQMRLQKEIEIRNRMKSGTISGKELDDLVEKQLNDADLEMDTKMAILMARYDFVYTRHMVSLASSYRIVGEGKGAKFPMRSEVLEDLVRVHAWQTFFERFNMGGDAGKTAMAIFNRESQFHKNQDGSMLMLSQSKMWDRLSDYAKMHPEQRATLDAIKVWEDKSKISFAQILNNQILKGGGIYDGSTWRAEIGVSDELRSSLASFVEDLRARAQAEGTTGDPENAGLAFQFASADRKSPEGLNKRRALLEKMRKRDPLIFMEFMAEERYKLLKDQFVSPAGKPLVDFDILSQALSLANNDINLNKLLLISPDIDLGGKNFRQLVAPYIERLALERGMTADIGKYQEFIQTMMEKAKGVEKIWAETDFPLTLRMGDLDWKDTDYHKAGTLSMARRGRDNVGMYKAASILREVMSNHELLFHPDPNKVIDKLLEMEKEMIGYTGNDDAAQAFTDLLSTYIRMNEYRSRRTLGWAPGGIVEWGLRQLTEVREETIEKGVKLLPLRLFGVPKDKIELVRQGIVKKLSGNLVSYAVEYGSAHGNAFDEKAISTIIATAQDRGGFLGKKHLAHDLMREFKVTLPYRVLASIRRGYWIVLVALLGAAIASAIKEEEKQH